MWLTGIAGSIFGIYLSSPHRAFWSPETEEVKEVPKEPEPVVDIKELRRKKLQAWRESHNLPEPVKQPPKSADFDSEDQKPVDSQIEPETVQEETIFEPNPPKEAENEEIDPLDAYMESLKNDLWNNGLVKGADGVVSNIRTEKSRKWRKDKGELMENSEHEIEYTNPEGGDDLEETIRRFSMKKEKVIQIDHTSVEYQPFRKCFYTPIPEIANMSSEEVQIVRRQLDNIKVKGKKAPRPVKTWAQTGLHLKTIDTLKRCGFNTPTPIQAQAVVTILSGLNLIGIAKTGSGKTLAYGLPLIRHVADQDVLQPGDGPIAIIMTPTRELCYQVTNEIRKFARLFGLKVVCIHGGSPISEHIAELKKGAEIIVCTPGRMIDMLAANNGRVTNLRRVTFIAIDEADRMFDMGFEPQVMRIFDNSRPDRQAVLFSATFPRQMEALARRILGQPIEIQVGGKNIVCSDVEQHVFVIQENQKFLKLLELLGIYGEKGSSLVFVDTQEHADDLLKGLLRHSYPCMALHGGIDQYDRDSIFNDFKNGDIRLLVSTSLAARGLDVRDLYLVVNYDCPNHYEDYVHRCGRTGRAGNKGNAFTFICPGQEKYAIHLMDALKSSDRPVPQQLEAMADSYLSKLNEQGKSHNRFNGFGGHGFSFNKSESVNYQNEQRTAFGFISDMIDDGDADENSVEIESNIERIFHGDCDKMTLSLLGASARKEANRTKLEKARLLAYEESQAADGVQSSGETILDMRSRAVELAEKLHERVGYTPSPTLYAEEVEKYTRYACDLEINDFPRQARWKITSREVLSQIEECSYGATVGVGGVVVERGKKPPLGERKLHISIAATSQGALDRAKNEIVRIIKEELVEIQGSSRYQEFGRYVV
ncbi:probable ATP-dependent RNA helicase DDX46 [Octopus sinensis]|uniref:RNA helicase n=1 Tax=Octopus sinensis TaxID=2607531 RepID=A0A6P7U0H6_9MOLL|nr:probable ATP-dependent RNA helicase DDX46 [Octopus sinensis]